MASNKKPAAKAAQKHIYLQNKEGRVFIATPALLKAMKRNKFGLSQISADIYDNAVKDGGMAEPLPSFEDEADEV